MDQIKAANEANLRCQLEQKIRELEGELGRARTTQQDSLSQRDSTRTELERYHQLYTEELRLRKSLAAKLERSECADKLVFAAVGKLEKYLQTSFCKISDVNKNVVDLLRFLQTFFVFHLQGQQSACREQFQTAH